VLRNSRHALALFAAVPLAAIAAEAQLDLKPVLDGDRHPNMPFVAQAGPLLAVPKDTPDQVFTIDPAVPSGTDDTAAALRALNRARDYLREHPGMTAEVRFPKGTWTLASPLFVDMSNLWIAGSGRAETTLVFTAPLAAVAPDFNLHNEQWAYRGGLIWVESFPGQAMAPFDKGVELPGTYGQGQTALDVGEMSGRFREYVGKVIHLEWTGDKDLLQAIYGDAASFPQIDWSDWEYFRRDGSFRYEWSNRIIRIDGSTLIMEKPLRLPVTKAWKVRLGVRRGDISGIVIKDLKITFPPHPEKRHLEQEGLNAVFTSCAISPIIRDLEISNADNGVILERTSHALVSRIVFSGERKYHHAISLRGLTHDSLVESLEIRGPVHHGISAQDLSSGNVMRNCVMDSGTLDLHRGMPFDNVRTSITLKGSGSMGGAGGPLCGRRIVNWNITIAPFSPPPRDAKDSDESYAKRVEKAKARYAKSTIPLRSPSWYVSGMLVGITGAPIEEDAKPWCLPPGAKGTVVAPRSPFDDLFEHQRMLWNRRQQADASQQR
jgi:hypothetical protein